MSVTRRRVGDLHARWDRERSDVVTDRDSSEYQVVAEPGDRVGKATEIPTIGGTEPFEVFYRREYDRSVRLAYVLSGSHWGAEDLAQDAFAEAHRNWQDIGRYESPGAWVRRVIVNRSVSQYRRRMADARALLRMPAGSRVTLPDLTPMTEEVWEAVRRLPRRQAQVIALTYLDELSLQEVADVLDIAVPTVGTHLQRGRKALSRTLAITEEAGYEAG